MGIYRFDREDAYRFAREQHIHAHEKGDELILRECPYCHGKGKGNHDKFSISLKTGEFHCFRAGCGVKGNMITLSKDFGFSLGQEVDEYYNNVRIFRSIRREKKPEPKPAAVRYLESRGIPERIAKEYNITTQRDKDNVLVFPFYDEKDTLQFVKYRKTDFDKAKDKNKEWCETDCKPILFGMNHCDPQTKNTVEGIQEYKNLILTEGQLDSLSLATAGFQNVVSVPLGAKGFTWVPYCWDFLIKFDRLLVFGDFEDGKISLLDEMKQRFPGDIFHVRPEDYQGCKDANEILQKHGVEALQNAVKNAAPVENPRIIPMEDIKRVDLSQLEKISTGFDSLDRIIGGLYFGQLVLLTGERGDGKSTLASQFATFAIKAGYSVFFYSGELVDWYLKAWFELQVAGDQNINAMHSNLGYCTYSIRGEVIPDMQKWYTGKAYIYDNSIIGDNDEQGVLLETMENAIRQYGCRMLLVDNLMTAMEDDLSNDIYRAQTNFVKDLARMAKRYNVLIILIAHPRKNNGSTNKSNDDVAGSGNITNLADVVLQYTRPKKEDGSTDDDTRLLCVWKNRLTGRLSRDGIPLSFQESSKRTAEINEKGEADFDWKLGWENDDELNYIFSEIDYPDDMPFD